MRHFFRCLSVFALVMAAGCASKQPPTRAKAPEAAKPSLTGLQQALEVYKRIASNGGWPTVSATKLQKGDTGAGVLSLRKRLAVTGDLPKGKQDGNVFDDDVEQALMRFQERHGFDPDGVAGKETLAALNVPVEDRVRQLQVGLAARERLPKDLGDPAVIVNVPDYRLKVIDGGKKALEMKVVLGQRKEWQTPLLDSQIKYLIFNPKWNVPDGIFEKEMIHHLRKNPDYLAKNNMVVLGNVDGKTQAVDAATIDWTKVSARNPGYRIVQREGAGNSLGRVKFMFPNPYAVYLHDTPQKGFFKRQMRALSHGCVRVEKPMELAEYLLKDDPEWPREKIEKAIASRRNRDVPLPKPVDVHIIYITTWVDDQGRVNFRDDVYGKDAELASELGL
ncbi:MAG TPA: L,D-transpeptidase family protein [bacterium]|nr:L,D-transpeptidase family protein [bacterium]